MNENSVNWASNDGRRYLKIVAYILLIIGGIGWLGGFLLSLGRIGPISSFTELPLGDLSGVAVDSAGRIYCQLGFYSRIQQYDATGKFIKGWSVNAAGGAFKIRVNPQDELEAVTARTNMFYRFAPTGEVIEKRQEEDRTGSLFGSFDGGKSRIELADGTVYTTRWSLLFPSVVKISPNGQMTKLVTVPFHKWLIMGPFPAWFLWMIGIAILGWIQRHSKAQVAPPIVNSKAPTVISDNRSYIDKLRGHRK